MIAAASSIWRGFPLPERLLLASSVTYGGVFLLLLAYGRPGLGIGQGFYVGIVLVGLATGPAGGALAGAGALFLYEYALHPSSDLATPDLLTRGAFVRLVAYVAAGAIVGYAASRARALMSESLGVLDELLTIAGREPETGTRTREGLESVIDRWIESGATFALLTCELADVQRHALRERWFSRKDDAAARAIARLLMGRVESDDDLARLGPTRFAFACPLPDSQDLPGLGEDFERRLADGGWLASVGWAAFPEDGSNPIALYAAALERLHARLVVRGDWQPTAAAAGLPVTQSA